MTALDRGEERASLHPDRSRDRRHADAGEAEELEGLQEQMLRVRRRLAPVPLEDLRRLHRSFS